MKKKFAAAAVCLLAFVVWTVLVGTVDVQNIGPMDSAVGFAGLNGWVHEKLGVHFWLYELTDQLSLIPGAICVSFAALGAWQWVKRKSIRKVDRSLLVLGGFYVLVLAAFVLFEVLTVNFRPVLIEGVLEASYPSSTTMLALCVMATAVLQWNERIKNAGARKFATVAGSAFGLLMVLGRLICGVHWLSDIIGGTLLSAGLVLLYDAACAMAAKKK